MAQGEFTKEEADHAVSDLADLFKALSKGNQASHLEHLENVGAFLEAAKEAAPTQEEFDARNSVRSKVQEI